MSAVYQPITYPENFVACISMYFKACHSTFLDFTKMLFQYKSYTLHALFLRKSYLIFIKIIFISNFTSGNTAS